MGQKKMKHDCFLDTNNKKTPKLQGTNFRKRFKMGDKLNHNFLLVTSNENNYDKTPASSVFLRVMLTVRRSATAIAYFDA